MTAGGWRGSFSFLSSFCLVAMESVFAGEFRGLLLAGAVADVLDRCPSKCIDLSSMWEGVGLLDVFFHREDIYWRWRQGCHVG